MSAVWVFRAAVLVRACWWVLGWLFGWVSLRRVDAFDSLHPYVELFAQATAPAVILGIHAGLWFFRRWARVVFVLTIGLALVYGAFQPHHSLSSLSPLPPFVLAVYAFMGMLDGVIVAMSFLPPVRDRFAKLDLTNR
jgi:hypothetical protein